MSRLPRATAIGWLVALAAAAASADDGRAGGLPAAAGDDHLWWIARDEGGSEGAAARASPEFVLWHASPLGEADRAAPVRRVAARFASDPEAIAAVGDSLWLVFPPETVADAAGAAGSLARREVLTLSTRRNPAVGHWYSVPPVGADPRPSLEVPLVPRRGGAAAGELLGFALDGPAERPAPWILLGGGPAERLGVRLATGDASPFGLRLFRLAGPAWEEVTPPEEAALAGARLVRTSAGEVSLIANDRTDGRLRRFDRDGESWTSTELEIDGAALVAWLLVDGRDAVATRREATLDLTYLRRPPARPLAWTSLPVPIAAWTIVGGRDGATVISGLGENATRTRIPALGTFADAEVAAFAAPGFGSGAWIHLPPLSALVLFVLLGLVFVRELRGAGEAPSVAASRPFELPRRVAALAFDAAPGAIAAMLFLDARPLDLVRVPFSALDVSAAIPATLVAGSACLLGFLGETVTGRSPGKWLFGGEVTRRDGTRAGPVRHLGRNLLKFLALVAPPLVIPTLLSNDGSGVPERLTGTAVARRT